MARITYKKKLKIQFKRYYEYILIAVFCIAAILLLIYGVGLNIYKNKMNNIMISDVMEKGFQEYTDFLNEAETKNVLNQKLAYEISSNYMAYYINSFKRRAILGSSFILMDTSGNVVYSSFSDEEMTMRRRIFVKLAGENVGDSNIYYSTYSQFNKSSEYVMTMPLYDDGECSGSISCFISGTDLEKIMRENKFDGVITDTAGHTIAAADWNMLDAMHKFSSDGGRFAYNGNLYRIAVSRSQNYDVVVYTLIQPLNSSQYTAVVILTLVIILVALGFFGNYLTEWLAELNSQSLDKLCSEITAIQKSGMEKRIELVTGDEFEDIADRINIMLDHVQALNEKNIELDRLNNQMERLRLEAQFDPHFLYNTLECIRYGVRLGDHNIDGIILKLTSLLRYSIGAEDKIVTVGEDLAHLKDYMDIIQYRFESRFIYNIDISNECVRRPCPRLCLQPIVENSIKYALPHQKKLEVGIKIWSDSDYLYLRVSDNGKGMDEENLRGMRDLINNESGGIKTIHYGLRNIARRLKLQFGPESCLELNSTKEEGTEVLLRIAIERKSKDWDTSC